MIHLIAAAGFVTFTWLSMYALCRHSAPPNPAPNREREQETTRRETLDAPNGGRN